MIKRPIILTFIIIFFLLVSVTIYKINKEHLDNLVLVTEKEFFYQAKNCYNNNICKNNPVTLNDLYTNKYITNKLTNPKTKKYYDGSSSVDVTTSKINLIS